MTVEITRLENGLRVATDRMDTVETATVGVYIGAGTRNEAPSLNGVAHLLEHMAFKGTRRRSARLIAEEIERVGGYLNAYTARELTAFYARILADDMRLAVDLLADIVQHSVFDPEELERERHVVIQEIHQADDTPDDVIFDHLQAAAFPDQGLGRPVLGREDLVRAMPREALLGYLADHYVAPQIVVAAAGKVDHDRMVALAEAAFSDLPQAGSNGHEPAFYQGGEFRDAKSLEQAHITIGLPGVGARDPDYYAQSIYSMMLGGGMSSRLFQEIREQRGLCYSVYSFVSSYRDGGLFGIYAGTGAEEAREVVDLAVTEVRRSAERIEPDDLERARAQLRASLLMTLESTTARAEALGQNLLIFGRHIPVEEIQDRLAAVTGDDLRRVAARLAVSPPTLATMGPVGDLGGVQDVAAGLR